MNRLKWLLTIFALILLVFTVNWVNANYLQIYRKLEQFIPGGTEPPKDNYLNLNWGPKTNLVRIIRRYEYFYGMRSHHSDLYIFEKAGKDWKEIYKDTDLGIDIIDLKIVDVNKDGKKELVTWWADGNAVDLRIHEWKNRRVKEIIWVGGRMVKICDIDKNRTFEILEYWRDYDKPFCHYLVNMYKWNGKEYVLAREGIPVDTDKKRGDRLILGKGKVIVLK